MESEFKSETLKDEIGALEFQKQKSFKAPPKEWVNHRLENLYETLNKNTCISALALKDILGTIQLEPISEVGEDYYGIINYGLKIASSADANQKPPRNDKYLDSRFSLYNLKDCTGLILLNPSDFAGRGNDSGVANNKGFKPYYVAHTKIQTLALLDRDKGSNWSHWWRRRVSNPRP